MRRWSRSVVVVAALAVAASLAPTADAAPIAPSAAASGTPSAARTSPATTPRHPDRPVARLVVRTKDGAAASTRIRGAAASLAGLPAVSLVGTRTGGRTLLGLGSGLPVADAWRVAKDLEKRADVLWAQPDLWVYPADAWTPDDSNFPNQWDLNADTGYTTHVASAWQRTKGRSDIVVAVLDTGLTVHPDFTSSVTNPTASDPIVRGYDFVALDDASMTSTPILRPWTANDGNGRDADPSDPGDWISVADNVGTSANGWFQGCASDTDPTAYVDSSWHGTFVAGTIAARQGNSIGVSGIAPQAKVQPIRVLGKCGGYSSDIDDAITWASGGHIDGVPDNTTPAAVINLSLGGPGTCLPSTQAAIDGAAARGAVVVVAAGNEGVPAGDGGSQPADCQGVVTTVAVDANATRASWSNYGPVTGSMTIAAPGVRTLNLVNTGTTVPVGGTYEWGSGTSFAAPHISGIVALLQSSQNDGQRFTPAQIRTLLDAASSASAGCPAQECGVGVIDLGVNAEKVPTSPPTAPPAPTLQASSTGVVVHRGNFDTGGLVTTVVVQRSTDGSTFTDTAAVDNGGDATVTGLTPGTKYWFRIKTQNSDGSTTSPAAGPEVVSTYAASIGGTTAGIERVTVGWMPAVAGDITSHAIRYRKVGDATWVYDLSTESSGQRTLSAWPSATPGGGTWELQIAAVHPGLPADRDDPAWLWSSSRLVSVTGLSNVVAAATPTVYPYVDGFQDTVLLKAATNRPGGSSGTMLIVNASGAAVRHIALARTTSWRWAWNGTNDAGRRVPAGRYTVRLYLAARTSSVALVASTTVLVATSQATKPTMTLSTTSLFPVRDGYLDSTVVRTTTTVPSIITWKLVRSGRTYWSATFSRRLSAAAVYAGARTGGGTVPAGTYVLYAYATGGEGSTVVSYRYVTVSAKKRVPHAFTRTWPYASTNFKSGFPNDAAYTNGSSVVVQSRALAVFAGSLPATATPYSGLALRVTLSPPEGAARPRAGYYLGSWSNPETLRYYDLASLGGTVPAPTTSAASTSGYLRWWVYNAGPSGTTVWVSHFTVTGYYYTLV